MSSPRRRDLRRTPWFQKLKRDAEASPSGRNQLVAGSVEGGKAKNGRPRRKERAMSFWGGLRNDPHMGEGNGPRWVAGGGKNGKAIVQRGEAGPKIGVQDQRPGRKKGDMSSAS